MINVDQVQRWRSGWAAAGGRIAAAQRAPAVGGAALSVLAVTELIARFGLDPRSLGRLAQTTSNTAANTQGVVVICLLCLSITLPLAFLRSGVAAVAFCAACVIALALFQGESSTSAVRVAGSGVSTHVTPAASTGLSTQSAVVLCLLCLATTLPLAFLRRAAAAVTICAACVIALALFQMLTVAGLCAQLIAGYRLGRGDPRHAGRTRRF